VTGLEVSKALGHSDTEVTFGHYADRTIVEQQNHQLALSVLAPTIPNAKN
jgi:hypothetical protein